MLGSCIFSLITYLIVVPPNCEHCSQVFLQMGFIMMTRFLIMGQFTMGMINCNEAYPVSILAIAVGWEGALSSIGNALSFIIFSDVSQIGVNPFLLSALIFFLLFMTFIWIPETLGFKAGDQIMEI